MAMSGTALFVCAVSVMIAVSALAHLVFKRYMLASIVVAIVFGVVGCWLIMSIGAPARRKWSDAWEVVASAFLIFGLGAFHVACVVGYPLRQYRRKKALHNVCIHEAAS